MLFFENIYKLQAHFKYLQQKVNNEHIFLVGGPLRDLLLGVNTNLSDVDLTCAGHPNDIFNNIDKKDISIFKTDKFGTITVIPKNNKKIKYELTPLRTEGQYEDFRHPGEINWTNSIIDDSKRRDFTINSMYYHSVNFSFDFRDVVELKDQDKLLKVLEDTGVVFLYNYKILILQNHDLINTVFENGKLNRSNLNTILNDLTPYQYQEYTTKSESIEIIIDPNKGIQDLLIKKIKAVGNPDNRFTEDALRIIRGVRFVNILNQKLEKIEAKIPRSPYVEGGKAFDFESNTWRSMKKNYFLVRHVAKERIKEELLKAFKGDNPFGFVSLLDELNLLKWIFPGLYNCKNVDQPVRYHPFDVYAHTMLTFWNIQKINKNYLVKFGMLYHDIGKPEQYYYAGIGLTPEERKLMHGLEINHPRYGVEGTINDFKALGFSTKEIDEIVYYVRYHMVPGEILMANEDNIPNKLRKLLSEEGYKKIDNLLDIAIADRLGQFNPLQKPNIEGIINLKKLLKKIHKDEGQFNIKNLAINGNDIMQFFKIQPGPIIGDLIEKAFNRVLDDISKRNHKRIILEYLKQTNSVTK